MQNKQINKFLLMFFISFTLFFSVSNAEFSSTSLDCTGGTGVDISSSVSILDISSYDYSRVLGIINNYLSNSSNENYNMEYQNMLTTLESEGVNIIVFKYTSSNASYNSFICFPNNLDVGFLVGSNNAQNFCFVSNNDESFFTVSYGQNNMNPFKKTKSNVAGFRSSFGTTGVDVYYSSVSIKQLSGTYSSVIWDGENYYYKAESNVPSIDYNLAGIIDVIKNSTEVQDNIYPYLEEYFIIPNGTVNDEQIFSIYFYYPSVNLSQFEYLYNDTLYYDLDKTSIDGVISNLTYYLGGNTSSNVVKDVQLATLYYNSETCTGDVYFTGNRTLDQLKSFESKTQPIIYTTKDIAYYSATWGETDTEWTAVPDTTKNILSSEITDSDGNIVDPVLPGSSSVVLGDTPFERFVNVIQTAFLGLVESISNGLISFTDYLLQIFGENVVTFAFLIIIKAITVLVSSVALVFRFVSFILTLVVIPASSTLLAVDVASNSSGLIFTGMNWGTRLIEGLNFIKTIQWNGLGLWTLFEVFVSSLEVVLLVKIVRKHYRTL